MGQYDFEYLETRKNWMRWWKFNPVSPEDYGSYNAIGYLDRNEEGWLEMFVFLFERKKFSYGTLVEKIEEKKDASRYIFKT